MANSMDISTCTVKTSTLVYVRFSCTSWKTRRRILCSGLNANSFLLSNCGRSAQHTTVAAPIRVAVKCIHQVCVCMYVQYEYVRVRVHVWIWVWVNVCMSSEWTEWSHQHQWKGYRRRWLCVAAASWRAAVSTWRVMRRWRRTRRTAGCPA